MTTKWVLPPSEVVPNRGQIPAPMVSSQPQSLKIFSPAHDCDIEIAHTEVGFLFERSIVKQSHSIEDFDQSVLQAVEYMIQEAAGNGLVYQADGAVSTAFKIVHSRSEKGTEDHTALNNLAVFGDAVLHPDSVNYDVQSLVVGLGSYFEIKDFLLEATEEEREQARTLVTAAARIKEPIVKIDGDFYSDDRTIRIESRELADFILSRRDDVERITQIVNERGTDNVDVIRDVLDHSLPALSEGVL